MDTPEYNCNIFCWRKMLSSNTFLLLKATYMARLELWDRILGDVTSVNFNSKTIHEDKISDRLEILELQICISRAFNSIRSSQRIVKKKKGLFYREVKVASLRQHLKLSLPCDRRCTYVLIWICSRRKILRDVFELSSKLLYGSVRN